MNLYVSIERDEPLWFVVRAYRDHRLIAEATLPKRVLADVLQSPLSSRQCRIAIAANQQALATVIIGKARIGGMSATLRNDHGYRLVDLSLDDLLRSGEQFSPGPLQAGPMRAGPIRSGPMRAGPIRVQPLDPGPARASPFRTEPVAAQPAAAE